MLLQAVVKLEYLVARILLLTNTQQPIGYFRAQEIEYIRAWKIIKLETWIHTFKEIQEANYGAS